MNPGPQVPADRNFAPGKPPIGFRVHRLSEPAITGTVLDTLTDTVWIVLWDDAGAPLPAEIGDLGMNGGAACFPGRMVIQLSRLGVSFPTTEK